MKKNLSFLIIMVLTICLVGFVFEQIAPASPVHAASENQPGLNPVDQSENETVSLAPSVQPVVFVITGLVVVLFGVMAVFPLLIEDPEQLLREANRGER